MLRRRPREAPRFPRRRRIRKLRLLTLLAVLSLLAGSAFVVGFLQAVAGEIPQFDPARQHLVERNGYVYARDGKTILAVLRGAENRVLVSYDEISPWMKHAIVAVEDRRFWDHRGVDLRGILRAAWADLRRQAVVEGGSTITQQYVKNVYARNQRSFARKIREAALAWQLERQWDKRRILTAYLNTIYFGNGAYGVQQAARMYFGHGAAKLTLPEAALLAGIPADPSAYDPIARPAAARARRAVVLRAMLREGKITRSQLRAANRAPLPTDLRLPGIQGPAPYFTNYVKEQLLAAFRPDEVFGGGLRVQTTIDLRLQRLAQRALWDILPDPEGPAGALVALDPASGDVLAMVGGRNYRRSQFNLAAQGRRQPGSAFKPFVLAAALERGISPATRFVSERTVIHLGDRAWVVNNYEDAYLGPIDLAEATVQSDNAVYAQLTRLLGPRAVVRMARRLGIRSELQPFFSIGLGAQAVNPLELARAYAAFANGGYRIDSERFGNRPRVVDEIRDRNGEVVLSERDDPRSRRVLSRRTVAWVNALLQQVVERGTGRRARLAGWPAAGKTGTTEHYGDAWFVGYTPRLVAAVWVGYPTELRPMETEFHGEPVAGGTLPALIWKRFMEQALRLLEAEPVGFEPPAAEPQAARLVVHRDGEIQLDNGVCRNRQEVVYFAGFGPRKTARCKPNEVEVPRVVGLTREQAEARLAAQPLTPKLVFAPAAPGQRVGIVLDQRPRGGRLSSYDEVVLVLAKPQHGVVPDVTGTTLRRARALLRRLRLRAVVAAVAEGPPGRVLAQAPRGGVAAAPGMPVHLVVARG